ncbi:MAG: type 11 methyltransferase [Fibrobacteres bacterium]|nr:type 11 methyltransferase [Fibrobacterota bacterium]
MGSNVPQPDLRPTRGAGRLEGLIARLRMERVLKAINPSLHGSEILDVGCGSYPLFLMHAPFRRKVGVDQIAPAWTERSGGPPEGMEILQMSLNGTLRLPFPDRSFSCVTSLAVIEHLEPAGLPFLMAEIHRVLKPSGQLVLTTPHAFADGILKLLARLGLVSKEEIDEHKSLFFHRHLRELLGQAGFSPAKTGIRGFLLGLNILAVAEK